MHLKYVYIIISMYSRIGWVYKIIRHFPMKDMQTSSLTEVPIFAETDEKSILGFLFFELWFITFTIFGATS